MEGRECRDFRLLAEIEGQPDEVTGTACRRPDGTWEAIST
jgi:surface antigen